MPDTFTFDSNTVADIDHFEYGWDEATKERVDADALGGKASVTLTPLGDGPRDLFVRSVDRAGLRSEPQQYHFYVRAGTGALARWAFEGNAKDDAFLGDRDGALSGKSTYAPGAVGSGIRLDAATQAHVTAPNTLRTDASFSVSAWAKVDFAGGARAIVSQDGTKFSGFVLWYRPENGGHWVFGMANGDDVYRGTDMAISSGLAQVGVWTHLTGVYDAAGKKLTLYVNGVQAGVATRTVPSWNAPARCRSGRPCGTGRPRSTTSPASIDEVQLYDRILSAAEVRAAVSTDNVQVGHWKFDETNGTTAINAVQGGDLGVLAPGASFGPGAVNNGVKLDGVKGQVSTSGPAVRTDRSFSVAAWVKLDPGADRTQPFTAVSQDGNEVSGFLLQYRPENGGKWQFLTPGADKTDAQNQEFVFSADVAASDTWTHLTGVYDEHGQADPAVRQR